MNLIGPKLNVFQRLILQWERLHPYNAAQAMRLSFSPTLEQLTSAWRATLVSLGLGRVWHQDGRVIHHFEPGEIARSTPELVLSDAQLDGFLSRQLNTPFTEVELPYRPFYCPSASGTCLGVVYHHWVCDSYCIRLLLRTWLDRLIGAPRTSAETLWPARRGYWHHFGPGASGWPLVPTVLQQLTLSARLRQCRRVRVGRAEGVNAQFSQLVAPEGAVAAIRRSSRQRGIKVNDLFLAALARTAVELAPLEPPVRRADLALGTIVDLRALPGRSPGAAFGLFLGFSNTILRSSVLKDDDRLITTIAEQSRLARDRRLAQASQVRMSFGLFAGKLFDGQRLREFYRKRLPFAGGISNVTLHNSWAAEAHPRWIRQYFRVSPTGPFMPLVLTPTTLGEQLNMGVTIRSPQQPDSARKAGEQFFAELLRLL